MSGQSPALSVGTLVAGKLRIVRALGIGGMGTVYEVEHAITRHRRALKLLHAEYAHNPNVVARFLREASAAGRIGSPHIVETFDAGTLESGEPYLVMEMLDGRSLADLLEERGRVSEREAIDWLSQACDGLQAAHDAGIIHRDIKPDNLFVERSGRVKVLDFGISKFDEALTGEKQLTGDLTLGTPYYMAPEQTSKTASVDRRADVYALGVVLYECVTGKKPFDAETYPQLVVRIHLGDYEPASSVCGTSALVDGIIAKAMARKPEARFQTPAELASALRDAQLATERTNSPFDSTQRARSLAVPQQPPPSPAEPAITPPSPVHEVATPPAMTAPREATLLSAGSQPPPPRGTPRSLVWLGAGLLAVAGFLLWKAIPKPGDPQLTPYIEKIPPSAEATIPRLAPPPSATEAPTASAATTPSIVTPPHAAAHPSTSKSAQPGSRAKQHSLEEQNPFR